MHGSKRYQNSDINLAFRTWQNGGSSPRAENKQNSAQHCRWEVLTPGILNRDWPLAASEKGVGRPTTAAPVLSNPLPLSCNSWERPTRSHPFHPGISSGQLFAIPHSDCLRDRGVAICACVSPWRWLPHGTAQLAPGNEAAWLTLGSSTLKKAVTRLYSRRTVFMGPS